MNNKNIKLMRDIIYGELQTFSGEYQVKQKKLTEKCSENGTLNSGYYIESQLKILEEDAISCYNNIINNICNYQNTLNRKFSSKEIDFIVAQMLNRKISPRMINVPNNQSSSIMQIDLKIYSINQNIHGIIRDNFESLKLKNIPTKQPVSTRQFYINILINIFSLIISKIPNNKIVEIVGKIYDFLF